MTLMVTVDLKNLLADEDADEREDEHVKDGEMLMTKMNEVQLALTGKSSMTAAAVAVAVDDEQLQRPWQPLVTS